jgi:LacI family transcriptional regulator
MQTIADQAGVSKMTVSRALKNHPSIPPATRARIQHIAHQLGYRPNPLVSALMVQLRHSHAPKSQPVIAFLAAHPDAVYASGHTYNAQIYAGATERATHLGYKLERFSLLEAGMTWPRMRRLLHARGIPGIILPPLPDPIPDFDFDWTDFANAVIGYSYKTHDLHRVANDQFNTIRTAMRHLTELGYRRIGLAIRHEDDHRVENKWTGGFLSFPLPSPGRKLPVFHWHYESAGTRPVTPDNFDAWEGRIESPPGFASWARRYRPDAIITLQPLIVRKWLTPLGLQVPRDIALVSLNLQPNQPRFSGINQNNSLLGAAAVELVVEQIYHNERGVPARAKTVTISGDWIAGLTA